MGRWLWAGVVAAVALGVALVVVIALTARPAVLRAEAAGASGEGAAAASTSLAQLIEAAEALAASTSPAELADPTAYTQLMGALASARGSAGAVSASASQDLVDAIDRVQRSRSAKSLADAQSTLAAVIATAVEVVSNAAGRVPDDAVRTELQGRIDAGRALLGAAATADAVRAQVQAITEQTAVVLEARRLGFREADGRWCAEGARSCLDLAWPLLTFGGERVELGGGEFALEGSGCFETDRFVLGRERVALLYCPAGAELPDGRRATGSQAGDVERDRLWLADGARLSELRARA